ncbi:hypothetical protein B0H10DRAFT_2141798 [Mycena sp. CBHHK59/15]|nr:hypothetical protein B0H10DRAFT_2141798 [Mycena sp. CBHHK59/15]
MLLLSWIATWPTVHLKEQHGLLMDHCQQELRVEQLFWWSMELYERESSSRSEGQVAEGEIEGLVRQNGLSSTARIIF